jgi:nitrite reductase (NADH) large subunit
MKYVIIGNGVAGSTAAANIRKYDSDGEITMVTDEAVPFYNRIRLIEYLAGESDEKNIVIYKDEWYERNNIRLLLNTYVSEIDKDKKQIITSPVGAGLCACPGQPHRVDPTQDGRKFDYDRLLIATGGFSYVPPIRGFDKKGVFTLRTVRDADEIINYAKGMKKAVLIGGGVLGLEAGNALRKRGLEITVVEFFPRLLPRQMDPEGGAILKAQLEGMGFTFYLGAKSREISGNDRVQGLVLEDGTKIDCDLIIISAGVRPSAELGKKQGLTVNKGLIVNDRMKTDIEGIYAAGDLIEHRGMFYGIWPAAQKQGEVAGINMAGGDALYEGTTMSNVLKVVGIDLASAGDIDADGKSESVVQKDRGKFLYKKLVMKGNIISGAILYGDISGYRRILKAIDEKKDISGMKDALTNWDLSVL